MLSYYEIKDAVNERLERAGLSVDVFPVAPGPISVEGYYYEIRGSVYIYAYTERGERMILCETQDIREFYYAILRDIVKAKALRYEVAHRVPGQDTRRIWMKKAEEWMTAIDPAFGERLKKEFAEILSEYPLEDDALTEEEMLREAQKLWGALTDEKWRFDLYIEKPTKGCGHQGGGEYYLYREEMPGSGCAYVLSYSERGEERILVKSNNFQDIQVDLAWYMTADIIPILVKKQRRKFKHGLDAQARKKMQLEMLSKCNPAVYEKAMQRFDDPIR